jgi:hypothetical protein
MEPVVIFVCMYVNAVSNSVMLLLYIWNAFYNTLFKIKYKLYTTLLSPPQNEKFWVDT